MENKVMKSIVILVFCNIIYSQVRQEKCKLFLHLILDRSKSVLQREFSNTLYSERNTYKFLNLYLSKLVEQNVELIIKPINFNLYGKILLKSGKPFVAEIKNISDVQSFLRYYFELEENNDNRENGTFLSEAIQYLGRSQFDPSRLNLALIITDGIINLTDNLILNENIINQLKRYRIQAIGVFEADPEQLKKITSSPDDVFIAEDLETIISKDPKYLQDITNDFCKRALKCSTPVIDHAKEEDLQKCEDFVIGEVCNFSCDLGFVLNRAVSSVVCGSDSFWDVVFKYETEDRSVCTPMHFLIAQWNTMFISKMNDPEKRLAECIESFDIAKLTCTVKKNISKDPEINKIVFSDENTQSQKNCPDPNNYEGFKDRLGEFFTFDESCSDVENGVFCDATNLYCKSGFKKYGVEMRCVNGEWTDVVCASKREDHYCPKVRIPDFAVINRSSLESGENKIIENQIYYKINCPKEIAVIDTKANGRTYLKVRYHYFVDRESTETFDMECLNGEWIDHSNCGPTCDSKIGNGALNTAFRIAGKTYHCEKEFSVEEFDTLLFSRCTDTPLNTFCANDEELVFRSAQVLGESKKTGMMVCNRGNVMVNAPRCMKKNRCLQEPFVKNSIRVGRCINVGAGKECENFKCASGFYLWERYPRCVSPNDLSGGEWDLTKTECRPKHCTKETNINFLNTNCPVTEVGGECSDITCLHGFRFKTEKDSILCAKDDSSELIYWDSNGVECEEIPRCEYGEFLDGECMKPINAIPRNSSDVAAIVISIVSTSLLVLIPTITTIIGFVNVDLIPDIGDDIAQETQLYDPQIVIMN